MLVYTPDPHHQFPSRHRTTARMETTIDKPLTAQERRDYEKNTGVIRKGMGTFVEVGSALKDIRDRRLYREEFPGITFEAYCRDRWDITKSYANYVIGAATVIENLTTIVVKPATESQARPLTNPKLDDPAEAWERAVETAPKDDDGKPKITAKPVSFSTSMT